jgi:hypothetical protein
MRQEGGLSWVWKEWDKGVVYQKLIRILNSVSQRSFIWNIMVLCSFHFNPSTSLY